VITPPLKTAGGEPGERRVAVLVDGELTGDAVVVDVLAGVQLVETVGVGGAGDATGGDVADRVGHRVRTTGIDRAVASASVTAQSYACGANETWALSSS
jgi:hypothetical protein